MDNKHPSLAELRKEQSHPLLGWLKKHLPFLVNWRSLFYYGLIVAFIGLAWMGYSVFQNYGTQLYGWDYMSQYIEFYFRYWDIWREFFREGHFVLYDPAVYLGGDSIGTMSYYGLFDPFVFLNVLFPRSWVPQMAAMGTIVKGVCSAFAMRAYLKYVGVKESTSRLGGVAYAFSGFVNFFVGFPSFVSAVVFVPLVMLGIERVLKERKIGVLAWSLGLLGIVSFFFLVVMCVWGACYAMWRFFWTIKKRTAKENWSALGLGILSFALGLMICSWSLLPSIRQSALSGRGQSIGYFYLMNLWNALKNADIKTVFARLFEMVGNHPGRELMGLASFFFPTCNYLWLPLYGGGASTSYDAWTSSLFCYTPMIIFFTAELIQCVRKKRFEPLIGFVVCSYLVFTIFAYFFFFAFTGDGYGRWYIVLVPLIIRQACDGIDERKDMADWQFPVASFIVGVGTILTFLTSKWVLEGKIFENTGAMTYWVSQYTVPPYVVRNGKQYTTLWLAFYQMGLVIVEAVALFVLKDRKGKAFGITAFAMVAIEAIVCGNLSFLYGSSYNYGKYYNGGYDASIKTTTATQLTEAYQYITTEYDTDTLYRAYADYPGQKNLNYAMGYNGTTPWSSLFNYGVIDLSHYSHIIQNDYYSGSPYGYQNISCRWSGYYNQKRAAFDLSVGMKYYAIVSEDTGFGNLWDDDDFLYNVPFGSECVFKNNKFRVYKSPYYIPLGHGVDDAYRKGEEDITNEDGTLNTSRLNASTFYQPSNQSGTSALWEIVRNEQIYLNGAIFEDNVDVPESVRFEEEAPALRNVAGFTNLSGRLKAQVYENVSGYGFHYQDPGAFLTDASYNTQPFSAFEFKTATGGTSFRGTYYGSGGQTDGKLVWSLGKTGAFPEDGSAPQVPYMNEDPQGAYFLMGYDRSNISRVYFIGDTFHEDGTLKERNAVLNYEYHTFDNLSGQGSLYYGGLFGIYAPGRVKYIVFSKKNAVDGVSPTPFLLMQEKRDFDAQYAKLVSDEYGLQNVDYRNTDNISCDTRFTVEKPVVTTLGYDAGWEVIASSVGDSGETIETKLQTYCLNGGFVGFIAPAGHVHYELRYKTPYLAEGTALAAIGMTIFFTIQGATLYFEIRRKRKESASI